VARLHVAVRNAAVTVLVVSDYRPGEEKSWNDLRATLVALADQDFDEPVEYLLRRTHRISSRCPTTCRALPGSVWSLPTPAGPTSLKNRACRPRHRRPGDGVSTPTASGSLLGARRVWKAMRERPDAVAISGAPTYPGRSPWNARSGRCRACVDRGTPIACPLDEQHDRPADDVLLEPAPTDAGRSRTGW
jgi:hypothetical protein